MAGNLEVSYDPRKIIIIFVIAVMAISLLFVYSENQKLKNEDIDQKREIKNLQEELKNSQSASDSLNSTLKDFRSRFEEMKDRNSQLRLENRKALASMTYKARDGATGTTDISFNVYNYGNSTARDVTGECETFRQDSDQSYNEFRVDLGDIEGNTAETKKRTKTFTETIDSSDQIKCEVTSCTDNCIPLNKRISNYVVNYPRNSFN